MESIGGNSPEKSGAHKAGEHKVTDHQVEKHACNAQYRTELYEAQYMEGLTALNAWRN